MKVYKRRLAAALTAAVCLPILASCSDSGESSSESLPEYSLTVTGDTSSLTSAQEEVLLSVELSKHIQEIQGILDANAAAELVYNTLSLICADKIVDGREADIPVGELPGTKLGTLASGDELQKAVYNILLYNRIEEGKVSWVISEQTRRPVSVTFETRCGPYGSYTGTAPEHAAYPGGDSELERLAEHLTEPAYISYADYLKGAEPEYPEGEDYATKTETLRLCNQYAQELFELVRSIYAEYFDNGGDEAGIKDSIVIVVGQNYGNPYYKKIAGYLTERYGVSFGDIYIRYDIEKKEPLFVQFWTDYSHSYFRDIVGQYPDPITDIEYPFTYGEKMTADN